MHPWIAQKIYFGLQILRGEPLLAAISDVRQTEFYSVDALNALQASRQIEQIRFATEHVPYYEKAYAPYKDKFLHIKNWDDLNDLLQTLPIVEQGFVREHPGRFTSKNVKLLKTHPDKTSGSSGTPLTFPCDQKAWAYRHATMFRCMEAFGVKIGEPYIYFYGLHWDKQARLQIHLRDWILNRVRVSAYEVDSQHFDFQYKSILQHRPTHFVGYPSSIYEFCVFLKERGFDFRKLKIKAVFLTSEPLLSYQRNLIEAITGSRCVDIYGSAEGGTTAFECPYGSLHIATETVWLQTRSGLHSGEAIVTDMMLRAFPMIRYAVGDEIILRSGICGCGRSHPMIQSIEGRSGEPILLPNGRQVNPHLPGYIFKPLSSLGIIRRYRFIHTPDNRLHLFLMVTKDFSESHTQIIEKETKLAFGDCIDLNIHIVDSIPHLPNAKHRSYVRSDKNL